MRNIIIFKALNGEEVVATLIEETESHYSIEKCQVLTLTLNNKDQSLAVNMLPWLISSPDGAIDVRQDQILGRVSIIPAYIEKAYLAKTSTIDLSAIS